LFAVEPDFVSNTEIRFSGLRLASHPSPTTVIKISLSSLWNKGVELFGSNRISKESEFHIAGPTIKNERRCVVGVFTRET